MESLLSFPWAEAAGAAALFILAFERVARLTPTESDDKIVQTLRKIAKVLSIDVPDRK